MRVTVTLERGRDGAYLAWVHELPGCFARGATRAEVDGRLVPAIRDWLVWAGEGDPGELDVDVVAEVEAAIEADEDTEVLLQADRAPLDPAWWARIDELLARSRRDVLAALDRWDLEERAGRRMVAELLRHVAFVELMYAAWTFDLRSRAGLQEFLGWTRGIATERLAALAESDDGEPTFAEWAGAPRPEEWTARKAARRLLWHELLHVRELREPPRG